MVEPQVEDSGDGFLRLLTPEQTARAQAELDREIGAEVVALQARIPEPQNHGYVAALSEVTTLCFGSRRFRVPPLPYPEGVELQHIMQRLRRLEKADGADDTVKTELLGLFERAVHLFWISVEPASLWDRLVWRWRANPFAEASESEIGELLSFFSGCRMRSRVRYPTTTPAIPSIHVISPRRRHSSRANFRRGPARMATR